MNVQLLSYNCSDSENASMSRYVNPDKLPRWAHVFALAVYSVCLCLALTGNSTVLIVHYRLKHLRTTASILLCNLALVDLLLASLTPFEGAAIFNNSWIFGEALCKIHRNLLYTFYTVSMITLAVLSAERYYAICFPFDADIKFRNKHSKILAAIWIASILLALPQLYFRTVVFTHGTYACMDNSETNDTFVVFLFSYYISIFILMYIVPLTLVTATFVRVRKALSIRKKELSGLSQFQVSANFRRKRNITRMLFVVAICFSFCWTPYNVLQLIKRTPAVSAFHPMGSFYVVIKMIAFLHSICNPFIYFLMSMPFRSAVKETFATVVGTCVKSVRCNGGDGKSVFYNTGQNV